MPIPNESQSPRSFGAKRKAWRDSVMCHDRDAGADFKLVAFIISAMLNNETKTTTATPSTLAKKVGRGFKMKRAEQAIDYYVKGGKLKRTRINGTESFALSLVLPDRSPAEVISKASKSFLMTRNDWVTGVMFDTRLTIAHRVAAFGLAAYLDPGTYEINEGCSGLADWTRTATKTMRRPIQALDEAGWLEVNREPGKAISLSPTMSERTALHVQAHAQQVPNRCPTGVAADSAKLPEKIDNTLQSGSEAEGNLGTTLDSGMDSGVDRAKPIIVQNQWVTKDHSFSPVSSLKYRATIFAKSLQPDFRHFDLGVLPDVIDIIEECTNTISAYDNRMHIGGLIKVASEKRSLSIYFPRDLLPLIRAGWLKKVNAKGGLSGELKYLEITEAGFAAVRAYLAKAA
jgi:hypothetical protein